VQAHTLGEVGNLGTVSLRVCSGTIVPIFIEIGSYNFIFDRQGTKNKLAQFFETRCINISRIGDHVTISGRNYLQLLSRLYISHFHSLFVYALSHLASSYFLSVLEDLFC